jgi:hypothetical protein
VPLGEWLFQVIRAVGKAFLEGHAAGLVPSHELIALMPLGAAVGCVLLGMRATSRRTRLFLLSLMSFCWLPFAAVDLLAGGLRTWIIRYQFPAVIALEISAALGLTELLMSRRPGRRRAGVAAAALLVVCGIVSRIEYGARIGGPYDQRVAAVAALVDQSPAPVVLTSHNPSSTFGNIFTLAHEVGDHVRLQVVFEPAEPPPIPKDAEDMFAWRVTEDMLDGIAEQGYSIEELEVAGLFRLSRTTPSGARGLPDG